MQARYLIIGVVIVIAAVTGVLIYQSNRGGDGASGDITVTQTVYQPSGSTTAAGATRSTAGTDGTDGSVGSAPGSSDGGSGSPSTESSSPAPSTRTTKTSTSTRSGAPDDGRPASNIPMKKLAPGEKAPQFVIFSFDGAGSHEKWHLFMDAAEPTDSRFTGFLSGIYLVETANKDVYTGPGHSPGKASIGFGGTKEEIVTEVEDLNLAYSRGHEIGTHYNGHFCVGNDPSGDAWSTADWNSELDQFFGFVKNWKKINGYGSGVPDLTVPTSAIKGGRTPCLEGDLDKMIPAWRKHGMTYDTSKNLYTGIAWPKRIQGIWEFEMPYVYSPGFKDHVMAMDYNFWVKFNGGQDQPETAPELRSIVRQTYDYMFDQAYHGNRAPVLIANHFNNWNGDSFNQPALAFMKDTCGRKDVYCATYSDVVAWMELQDPAVLAALQDQAPVATGA